ncbi:hypothetical protein M433DRAFT_94979, partial [Acidomyces richmondensis BFW]
MSSKDTATKLSPTANIKPNRLPAPALFVGPPSRNTSQLSVSRQVNESNLGKPGRDPLTRQKSALSKPYELDAEDKSKYKDAVPTIRKSSEKELDAKWREMQSTLNEVELTAQSSTHVFGESHAAALDELRKAQVELAKAWGRGNEEKAKQAAGEQRNRTNTNASASTMLSNESGTSTSTVTSTASQMEDETAQDIRLANERRAANEAYFQKVDEGVKDVVAKLEAVAAAMRGVESESRSLWSET